MTQYNSGTTGVGNNIPGATPSSLLVTDSGSRLASGPLTSSVVLDSRGHNAPLQDGAGNTVIPGRNPTLITASAVGGSWTPDCNVGDYFIHLDQALTVNAPINAVPGCRLRMHFIQTAASGDVGYPVTWDTVYQEGYPRVSLAQYQPTICDWWYAPGAIVNAGSPVWLMDGPMGAGQALLIGQNNPGPGALNMSFGTGWGADATRPPWKSSF